MHGVRQVLEISYALLEAYSRHQGFISAEKCSRFLEFLV